MNRLCPVKLTALFLLILLLFSSCTGDGKKKCTPTASSGVLDLTRWDFGKRGEITLKGEWEFYWNRLLTPGDFENDKTIAKTGFIDLPSVWTKYVHEGKKLPAAGYATYRLKILTKGTGRVLGLNCRYVATAYNVFVNGKKIGSTGKVGTSPESSKPAMYYNLLLFPNDAEEIDIILQVSNFHHFSSGPWDTILLGPEKVMVAGQKNIELFDFFIFGSIIIIALYHFSLFLMRRQEKTPLYFGLLCLVVAIRGILIDKSYSFHFFSTFPGDMILRFDFISLTLTIIILAHYVYSLFPAEFSKHFFLFISGFLCLFFIPELFVPSIYFTWFLYPLCFFTFILCLYIFPVSFLALRHKREGALIFFTSYIISFFMILNDILYATRLIYSIYLLPFGLLFFTFAQSLILASRSSRAFNRVEKMTARLRNFYKDRKEKERLQKELEIAAQIQVSMIPEPPLHSELQISCLLVPTEVVGGDYYDIIIDNQDFIWFAIGDVSGHGVTPGLIMMMAQTAFSTYVKSREKTTPRNAFIEVNKLLYENIKNRLKEDHFMTMNFLKYAGEGKFIYAGAHTPIIIYRKKSHSCQVIETAGIFLGMIPDVEKITEDLEIGLEKDDILLLYTDGIIEARCKNDRRRFYDLDNLQNVLVSNAGKKPEHIKDAILDSVLDFCGCTINDDITILIIKRQ